LPRLLRPQWPRALRVDLDAVLGKALQRAPEARYAGAHELADDLRRHLAGQPVLAQPPHAGYLLRKALRRHRVAAAGVVATALALVAGGGVAAWQAQRATQARDLAQAAHERSRTAQAFLQDLIDDAARAGQPLRTAELLDRAETLARQLLGPSPDQLAAVLGIVGQSAYAQGAGPRGPQLPDEARQLSRNPDLQAELACMSAIASTQKAAPEAAQAELRRHADDAARDPGVRLRCTLTLAQLLIQNGQLAEAEQRLHAAEAQVAQLKAMQRDRSTIALGLFNTWGTLANVSGEPERALQRWRHLVDTVVQDDPQSRVLPYHLAMLANGEIGVGAYADAAARLQQALQAAQRH